MSVWIRRLSHPILLGIAVLVLTACTTLGPEYEPPEVKWLEEWESDLYGRIENPESGASVDLSLWWHLFDDPVLNQLIDLAKAQNPTLRIAGLRVLESRAALGIANSSRYPQVQQATGAITHLETQLDPGPDDSLQTYQTGLNLGWEFDFWGRFQRSIESADAAFFASIFNQHNAQVLLSAQVADFYFAYRTVVLRIFIARKNSEIQKRSFEITTQLYESGEKSELDLQQAKTQYMSTLSSIPGIEITRTQLRNAIGALLGRAPGNLPELDDNEQKLPVMDPVLIQDIPAQLLMRRPDVRAAAAQIAAQSAQIGIAEAEFYPSVSLLGSIGWSGNSESDSSDSLSLGIGPSFSWNLFDHGRIRNNVRIQDVRLQQAIENFQNVVLQAAREIDDAAISLVKTREQKVPQRESTVAAIRSLELANVLYREGYENFQRVIEAQRQAASQAQSELINNSNHINAVIRFYKAIGGGWMEQSVVQMLPEKTRKLMEERTDWGDLLNEPLPESEENDPLKQEASSK